MAFEAAWPARPRLGARSGRSGSLTAVARARSASLGSSGLPLGLGRTCSKLAAHPLGFAEVNVFAATRSGANKNIRKHCARVTMVLERCDCLKFSIRPARPPQSAQPQNPSEWGTIPYHPGGGPACGSLWVPYHTTRGGAGPPAAAVFHELRVLFSLP